MTIKPARLRPHPILAQRLSRSTTLLSLARAGRLSAHHGRLERPTTLLSNLGDITGLNLPEHHGMAEPYAPGEAVDLGGDDDMEEESVAGPLGDRRTDDVAQQRQLTGRRWVDKR